MNVHMHTRYSDGGGSHRDIARAALRAGLDAVVVTDHNVYVDGIDRYHEERGRKVLVLSGEEVHDRRRAPQKNHLLVLGAWADVAARADDMESLLKAVQQAGGLSFLAHPDDPSAPAFHEPDISWEEWSVTAFTGIELWNGFSELKTLIPTKLHGVLYAFFPALIAHAPSRRTLERWDQLLSIRPTVAIGGSDAHAIRMHLGPLNRIVFPYDYHFGTINTHVLLEEALTGNVAEDAKKIFESIASGHCFVANDSLHHARGFRFMVHGQTAETGMGDQIPHEGGLTLEAQLPARAEIRLIKDGAVICTSKDSAGPSLHVHEPGAYRIEAYRRHLGQRRGWIFSNPVYIR